MLGVAIAIVWTMFGAMAQAALAYSATARTSTSSAPVMTSAAASKDSEVVSKAGADQPRKKVLKEKKRRAVKKALVKGKRAKGDITGRVKAAKRTVIAAQRGHKPKTVDLSARLNHRPVQSKVSRTNLSDDRPVLPKVSLPPELKVDAGSIRPSAGSARSPNLSVESNALPLWMGAAPLALMLGGIYVWARRRTASDESGFAEGPDPVLNLDPGDVATSSAMVKADLLRSAEPFYLDLQQASCRKDHDFFFKHCTEALATSMILDSETIREPATPQVDSLKAELVDLFEEVNRYVASVQYTAHVQRGNTQPRTISELWHFVREPDAQSWRLAAVEAG